jgi:hypothetical protein
MATKRLIRQRLAAVNGRDRRSRAGVVGWGVESGMLATTESALEAFADAAGRADDLGDGPLLEVDWSPGSDVVKVRRIVPPLEVVLGALREREQGRSLWASVPVTIRGPRDWRGWPGDP